ncbi:hypothetical protein V1264_009801 [Littorina saxatilis]|uniref:Chitin-binding type-2 domain-containing protein n=3 Tax=Littorina saxatilis TaxID=31220 RepID=A0AAN9AMW5_9CAEN
MGLSHTSPAQAGPGNESFTSSTPAAGSENRTISPPLMSMFSDLLGADLNQTNPFALPPASNSSAGSETEEVVTTRGPDSLWDLLGPTQDDRRPTRKRIRVTTASPFISRRPWRPTRKRIPPTTPSPFFMGRPARRPVTDPPTTTTTTMSPVTRRRPRGPMLGMDLDTDTYRRPTRRPPQRRPSASQPNDPFGFSGGYQGNDIFAFPQHQSGESAGGDKSGNSQKITTSTTTTTTTPQSTTTEKPAEVIIIAPNVRAELGMSPTNNLKVTCHAFQAWGWSYMSLSRYEGTGHVAEAVEFLGGVYFEDEFPFIPIDSRMSHHRVHRDKERISFTLESQYAMCEDKGTYLCEIIVNGSIWSKDFDVDIRKKPDVPVLTVPSDIIAGEEVTFTTTWNAGAPLMGTVVHNIIKGFTNLPNYIRNETTATKKKSCEMIVKNSYMVRPDLSWNGTQIQVSIVPYKTATPKMLETLGMLDHEVVTLSVISNDTCVGHTNMILPHPYTCRKYINCNYGIIKVEKCRDKKCFHPLQLACY